MFEISPTDLGMLMLYALTLYIPIYLLGMYYDVQFRRLPSWMCDLFPRLTFLFFAYSIACFIIQGAVVGAISYVVSVVLIIGVLLYLTKLNKCGLGDVKMIAAILFTMPFLINLGEFMVFLILIAGVCMLANWRMFWISEDKKDDDFAYFPFMMIICAALISEVIWLWVSFGIPNLL